MSQYQVGGSLRHNDPTYVVRQADAQLYQALNAGEFCYVLNSRQMGKSSLLVRTKHRLEAEGFRCGVLDMTSIGGENTTPVQWYKGVMTQLWLAFKLRGKFNLKAWWQETEDISLAQRLSRFIAEGLLENLPTDRLVIFIDEIDKILSLDFPIDDFFALIRYCYNQRATNGDYDRITVALFGVATPSDLVRDKIRTPFNIGKAIQLQGFREEEALPLLNGLAGKAARSEVLLQEILGWTSGQPFLTQKLCDLAWQMTQETEEGEWAIPAGQESVWVEQLVRSRIISRWESQDEPEHLRTIRNRLECNPQRTSRILGLYQQILQGAEIEADEAPEKTELVLSGLIVRQQGVLKVKNRIYEAVFDAAWVTRQLASLRPYANAFAAWLASRQQDESQLLRGSELRDALIWSQGKSLSDLDYQFLAASQELSRRQTQNALDALEQANHLLLSARRRARKESLRHRIWRGWIAIAAACVVCPILLLRLTGLLQSAEWDTLDWFFRLRPLGPPDSRIVIVTIDETDISQIGQWPLPDAVLTEAIDNLKAHKPQAIGIDLYRDLPVEPGYQALVEAFKSTPNLIGIEKVAGSRVAPPLVLDQLGQVGFADVVLDADGKIRRGLLSVELDGQLHLSFAVKLALIYLESVGITPEQLDEGRLRLGQVIFTPFDANDGGYVRASAGGYQILLNFRGTLECFPTISLSDVLANRIPAELLNNSSNGTSPKPVVMIGGIAESLNDLFHTPYSSSLFRSPQRMAGVVVHANIASQILSAALDGRPPIRVWSNPQEGLWILVWAVIGAVLSWRLKFPSRIAIGIVLTGLGLSAGTYLAFVRGWWLPLVPSLLGLVGAAIVLPMMTNKQLERLQLRRTLELLRQNCATAPAVGRIAIEYLKKSENQGNQSLIGRWLAEDLRIPPH